MNDSIFLRTPPHPTPPHPTTLHLYIHIPFCRYRCDYCDFFTRTHVAPHRRLAILQRIDHQDRELLQQLGNPAVRTVYIGGGTPSSLNPAELDVLGAIILRHSSAREITVELNPEDITEPMLQRLAAVGVNRLSVGIQTVQEAALRRIGRHTTLVDTLRGLEVLRRCWRNADGSPRRWSADLIAGIPDRDSAAIRHDLETILQGEPDHLSVYELSVEPSTKLAHAINRGKFVAPGESAVLRELQLVGTVLKRHGYRRYEISNYARPGGESQHNLGYWRMTPHLGLGPGAVGTVIDPDSQTPPVRYTNTRSFSRYLTAPDFGMTVEPLGPTDLVKELLMMGLRTRYGVNRLHLNQVTGQALHQWIPTTLARWNLPADADSTPDNVTLPEHQWMILNRFLTDAFHEIDLRHPSSNPANPDKS